MPAKGPAKGPGHSPALSAPGEEPIRLDKWLWHARLCKTRALAAKLVSGGHVRVNGQRASRPGRRVGPGDTLTLVQHGRVRVVHILAPGTRRGPAPEARALYDEPGVGPEGGPELQPELEPEEAPEAAPVLHDCSGRDTDACG